MLPREALKQLKKLLGKDHVRDAPEDLRLYAYDATPFVPPALPDAVVFPGTAEEVAAVVQLANRVPFSVIARGAGTNLTGGTRPVRGGVVLSTQRLHRIVEIDTDNLQVVVQPGVVNMDLRKAVEERGLFYPPDPQSMEYCTIGGNLAENAGGPRAFKYGVTRQHVLALQAVLPTGELVRLGARTIKSVAGYDLLSLLVGSEGTLGIITEATLRLQPLPEASRTLLAVFAEMKTAAAAVSATLRAGVVPAALEFLDRPSIRCVEEFEPAGLPVDAGAVLVVEMDGNPAEVEHATARAREVLQAQGAAEVRVSTNEEEADALWKARRAVGPALARIAPIKFNEDIVVPRTRLPDAILGIHAIAGRCGIECACFGHAGDGNIHVNFLTRKQGDAELEEVDAAVGEVFDLVVRLGGSITGEHGVGTTKQAFLPKELSADVIRAMAAIKRALDPRNVLNPGKIFPPEEAPDGSHAVR